MKKIYLAIPYTFNPELSVKVADQVAAALMLQGHVVFSPISQSHRVADFLADELRFSQEFWMSQDLPFVEWADEVCIVLIGENGMQLVEESKGVQTEMKHATQLGKPISYTNYTLN